MILLAMDRATVRRVDANGFLHVEVSNISKANVCPYFGREIPDWETLGLEPERVYRLYRDQDELARAAPTFNNIPVLSEHVPVDAEELPKELIIGSTGNDTAFVAPYLQNRLAVWSAPHRRAIDNHTQKELSSSYRYRADMTPGQINGFEYDGVMRDIIGNHVALVIEGRAGPDVVVGDEVMKLKSRTALMVSGALAALVRPKLAADAKVDLSTALKGVDAKSIAMDGAPAKLAQVVLDAATPHLAADETLDLAAIEATISAVQPLPIAEDAIADKPKPKKGGTVTVEGAEDEDDGDMGEDDKPAMDQATVDKMIATAVSAAETRVRTEAVALDQAKRDVQPFVGEVAGMDSADAVYKLALDAAKVDLTGVDAKSYRAMVGMLPKPGERQTIAQDYAQSGTSVLAKILPNLPQLIRS